MSCLSCLEVVWKQMRGHYLTFLAKPLKSWEQISSHFRISTLFSLALRLLPRCFLWVRKLEVIWPEVDCCTQIRWRLSEWWIMNHSLSHSVSSLCSYRAARAAKKTATERHSNTIVWTDSIALLEGGRGFTQIGQIHILPPFLKILQYRIGNWWNWSFWQYIYKSQYILILNFI